MGAVREGRLEFQFSETWQCTKFDDWAFYRNQYSKLSKAEELCKYCSRSNPVGVKAVDIIAIDENDCCWLIEIKDYRTTTRTKTIAIADEMALKVRDTLAAVFAASVNANDGAEMGIARQALKSVRFRVVLHLEQPAKHSKLFPRAIEQANVQLRLRQLVKPIDAHPMVLEMERMNGVGWSVNSV